MFKFTNIVMYFAPVAVGAALAYTVGPVWARGVLVNLGSLVSTYYGAPVGAGSAGDCSSDGRYSAHLCWVLKAVGRACVDCVRTSTSEAAAARAWRRWGVRRVRERSWRS